MPKTTESAKGATNNKEPKVENHESTTRSCTNLTREDVSTPGKREEPEYNESGAEKENKHKKIRLIKESRY